MQVCSVATYVLMCFDVLLSILCSRGLNPRIVSQA
jgi:hypothetical protein